MANNKIKNPLISVLGAPHRVYSDGYGGTLDTIVERYVDNTAGTYGIDVWGSVSNCGGANHNFIFGWLNAAHTWGWAVVLSFAGMYFGMRNGSSSFEITKCNGGVNFKFLQDTFQALSRLGVLHDGDYQKRSTCKISKDKLTRLGRYIKVSQYGTISSRLLWYLYIIYDQWKRVLCYTCNWWNRRNTSYFYSK